MGNIFDQPSETKKKDISELYITNQEKIYLQLLYKKLLNNKNQNNINNQLAYIHVDNIKNVFGNKNSPVFNKLFQNYIMIEIISYNDFEQFIINCTRISSTKTLQTFWNIIITNPDIERSDILFNFFTIVFELAYYMNHLSENNIHHKDILKDIITKYIEFYEFLFIKNNIPHHVDSNKIIEFKTLQSEINSISPYISKVFESYISTICFPNVLQSPSYKIFNHPRFNNTTIQSEILNEYDLLPLALYSETLQSDWECLYSTSRNGISFNRIVHHILGYNGPTCILIKCNDAHNSIIGAYTADKWKESNRFYGSSKSFLFSLHPKLRMYRSKHTYASESSSAYQWLNTKSYSLPHGLGFGGSINQFRLFIPDSLENCSIQHSCPTYEDGKLLLNDDNNFEIQCLEVWGCGGSNLIEIGIKSQLKDRENMDIIIQQARQVDKAAFFNNDFDKEFLLSNTMSHTSVGKIAPIADV